MKIIFLLLPSLPLVLSQNDIAGTERGVHTARSFQKGGGLFGGLFGGSGGGKKDEVEDAIEGASKPDRGLEGARERLDMGVCGEFRENLGGTNLHDITKQAMAIRTSSRAAVTVTNGYSIRMLMI